MPGIIPKWIKNLHITGFILCFFLVSCFLVSCGPLDKKGKETAGNKDGINTDQQKIAALESELENIRQDQTNIKLEIKKKDASIEKLQDTIKTLETKITYFTQNTTKELNPPDLYKKARNLLTEENYLIAADLFANFIKKFPKHDLAGNAAYWLGECYYSLGKYKKAILVFKDLADKYPKSEKVPGSILKTGYAYLRLDDSNRSHHYLKKVLMEYPFSPAAEKAQEKLKSFE